MTTRNLDQPGTRRPSGRPITISEETKNWKGQWTETVFQHRGAAFADVDSFFAHIRSRIHDVLTDQFEQKGPLKLIGTLEVGMRRPTDDHDYLHAFHSGSKINDSPLKLLRKGDIEVRTDQMLNSIKDRIHDYAGRGSGWNVFRVNWFKLKCMYSLRGRKYFMDSQ